MTHTANGKEKQYLTRPVNKPSRADLYAFRHFRPQLRMLRKFQKAPRSIESKIPNTYLISQACGNINCRMPGISNNVI